MNDQEKLVQDKKYAKVMLDVRGPAFDAYLEMLVDKLVSTDEQTRVLDGAALYRSQGRAQLLVELISQADTAEKTMARVMASVSRSVRKHKGNRGTLG